MDEVTILYTTWPDAETAEALGRLAVEGRLAACANVLAPMRSIYRWDGEIHCDCETPMLLKTTPGAVERLRELILRYHPHDTPCVLALRTDPAGCNPGYVQWLESEVF
jgi:periplasmic divalent cation tolerance protein